jgi:hypothetical protein
MQIAKRSNKQQIMSLLTQCGARGPEDARKHSKL